MPTPIVTVGSVTESGQQHQQLVVTSNDATQDNPLTLRDFLTPDVYSDNNQRIVYEDGVFYTLEGEFNFNYMAGATLSTTQSGIITADFVDSDYLTQNRIRRMWNGFDKDGNFEHGFTDSDTQLGMGENGVSTDIVSDDSDSDDFSGHLYITHYDSETIVMRNMKPRLTQRMAYLAQEYYVGDYLQFDGINNRFFRIEHIDAIDNDAPTLSDDSETERGIRFFGSWHNESGEYLAAIPQASSWIVDTANGNAAYNDDSDLENGRSAIRGLQFIRENGYQLASIINGGQQFHQRAQNKRNVWRFDVPIDLSGCVIDLNAGSNTVEHETRPPNRKASSQSAYFNITGPRLQFNENLSLVGTPEQSPSTIWTFNDGCTMFSGREVRPGFFTGGVQINYGQQQRGGTVFNYFPYLSASAATTVRYINNRFVDLEQQMLSLRQEEPSHPTRRYSNRALLTESAQDSIIRWNFNRTAPFQIQTTNSYDNVRRLEINTPAVNTHSLRFSGEPDAGTLRITQYFPGQIFFYNGANLQEYDIGATYLRRNLNENTGVHYSGDGGGGGGTNNVDVDITYRNPESYFTFQREPRRNAAGILADDFVTVEATQDYRFNLIHPEGNNVNFESVRHQLVSDTFSYAPGGTFDVANTTAVTVGRNLASTTLTEATDIRTFDVDQIEFHRAFVSGETGNQGFAYDSEILLQATALGFHRDTFRTPVIIEQDLINRTDDGRAIVDRDFVAINGFGGSHASDSDITNLDELYDRLVTYCFETDRDIREYVDVNLQTGTLRLIGTVGNVEHAEDEGFIQGRNLELIVDTGNVLGGSPYISPPRAPQDFGFTIDSDDTYPGLTALVNPLPADTIIFPVADSEIDPGEIFTQLEFADGFRLNTNTDLASRRATIRQVVTLDERDGVVEIDYTNNEADIDGHFRLSVFDSDVNLIATTTSVGDLPLRIDTTTGPGYSIGQTLHIITSGDAFEEDVRTVVADSDVQQINIRLRPDAFANHPDQPATIRASLASIDFDVDLDVRDSDGDDIDASKIPSGGTGTYLNGVEEDSELIDTNGRLLVIQYRDIGDGVDSPNAAQSNAIINKARLALAYQRVHLRNRRGNTIQDVAGFNYEGSMVNNFSRNANETQVYLRQPNDGEMALEGIRFRQKGTPRQLTIDSVTPFGGAAEADMIVGQRGVGNYGVTFIDQIAGSQLTIRQSAETVMRQQLLDRFHDMNDSEFFLVMRAVANLNPTQIKNIRDN